MIVQEFSDAPNIPETAGAGTPPPQATPVTTPVSDALKPNTQASVSPADKPIPNNPSQQTGAAPPMGSPAPGGMSRPNGAVPPMGSPAPGGMPRPNGVVPPMGSPAPGGMPRPNGAVPPMGSPAPGGMPRSNGAVPPVPPAENWYQNHTPQFSGLDVPPQVPPNGEPLSPGGTMPAKRERRIVFWLRAACILLAVLLLYCIGSDVWHYRTGSLTTDSGLTKAEADGAGVTVVIEQQKKPESNDTLDSNMDADGAYTVEGVAKAVRPSVVEIAAYGEDESYSIGTGSGIILTEDGYIITNAHVIAEGQYFEVLAANGTTYVADVVGKDAKTDLAVLKIDGNGMPAAVMGDSDEVELGEAVVAIGNPAGLTGTVTNGIISGLNRMIRADATGFDMNCLQTNAAISPGNSGGALVNMYGQVIGITSSKYVSSSYEGLGFAITINEALPVVEALIEYGHVPGRVRVGISFVSLQQETVQWEFADTVGMETLPKDLTGVWIVEIAEDCDIAQTELMVNDVIVSVEGMAVSDYDSLNVAIANLKAGETMEARCRRYAPDGTFRAFTIRCKLMEDTSGNY